MPQSRVTGTARACQARLSVTVTVASLSAVARRGPESPVPAPSPSYWLVRTRTRAGRAQMVTPGRVTCRAIHQDSNSSFNLKFKFGSHNVPVTQAVTVITHRDTT